jgi:methylated-DNA-protein-cysteine methyltransferase related protein
MPEESPAPDGGAAEATPREPESSGNEFSAIYARVRAIPPGRVMSSGEVGQAVGVTARTVGWAMTMAVDDGSSAPIPWHRVVGADGYLRIARRSAELAREQRERLEAEGVRFGENGCVLPEYFAAEPQTALEL